MAEYPVQDLEGVPMSDVMQITMLEAEVARLEGEAKKQERARTLIEEANAALAAALGEQMVWKGQEVGGGTAQETHTCECFIGRLRGADCLSRCQQAQAALSDKGEGWLPPKAKALLKDISGAWLGSATPGEFWDKFKGDDLWGRITQIIGPESLDALEVR